MRPFSMLGFRTRPLTAAVLGLTLVALIVNYSISASNSASLQVLTDSAKSRLASYTQYAVDSSSSSPLACRDPYRLPGYLFINEQEVRETQWVPFPDTGALDVPPPQSARYPTNEIPLFTNNPPPPEILSAGPHNWFTEALNYNTLLASIKSASASSSPIALSDTQQRLIRRMNWLHNRRVLVLGDSVDRIMIQEFCRALGTRASFTPGPLGGQHTTYSCQLPHLNFTIFHWHVASMYPMRPSWWWLPKIKTVAFEDRFPLLFDHVRPNVTGLNGLTPDLILFQSGLWDERAFRESSRNMVYPGDEKLSPEELEVQKSKRRKTGLGREGRQLSWDELMFFKARMEKFIDYIRDYFGSDANLPMMYRGLTTRRESDVADLATINMDRLSRSLAEQKGIEIFEWARMTAGFSDQYLDYLHIDKGPLNALWSNMILYYLFRAAGGSEYNGTLYKTPDPVGQYVFEGQGATSVPNIAIPENPDTQVSPHWAECHPYNVHWGGR